MDEGLWVMTANWGRPMSHLKHTGLRRSDGDDNNDSDYFLSISCASDCVLNILCALLYSVLTGSLEIGVITPTFRWRNWGSPEMLTVLFGSNSYEVADGTIKLSSVCWQSLHSLALHLFPFCRCWLQRSKWWNRKLTGFLWWWGWLILKTFNGNHLALLSIYSEQGTEQNTLCLLTCVICRIILWDTGDKIGV